MPLARLSGAVALAAASTLALPQVYTWKDPADGGTRVSNIAPPWYAPSAPVSGPRVVVTRGQALVDDTALPLEARSRLAGRAAPPVAPSPPSPVVPSPPAPVQPPRLIGEPEAPEGRPLPIRPEGARED